MFEWLEMPEGTPRDVRRAEQVWIVAIVVSAVIALGMYDYSAAVVGHARAIEVNAVLFAVGALFPILPFLWLQGLPAIAVSVALAAFALFSIGIVTSLFNGRSPWFSAARQVVIGCAAAAVTYGAGAALGVSVS